MRKHISIPTFLTCISFILITASVNYAQQKSIPDFLKEKQIWNEKLVVIYAPADQQSLVKEQINVLYPSLNLFKEEKIVVVQIPAVLSASDRLYLKQKLRYHEDRLNIWVIDEQGNLRMSSTKVNSANQFLRVLDIETRPEALAKTQLFGQE